MRFSRGQNPPRGNEPEPRETPDPAAPDPVMRGDERSSWFAPLPPETAPSERPRTSPVTESSDPNDLYPPEYRPGRGRDASRAERTERADAPPRDPSTRDAYRQGGQGGQAEQGRQGRQERPGREPAQPRNDDRDRTNRDAYERSTRERTAGNPRPNPRPGGRDTPSTPPISEQFGWQTPERERTPPPPPRTPPLSAYWEEREERIRQEESGELPRVSPPGAGAYNPYASGVWPATSPPQDPRALAGDEGAYSPYSQQFTLPPLEPLEDVTGQMMFPSAPVPGQGEHESAYRPDPYAPDGTPLATSANGAVGTPYALTRSGRLATTGRPGTSGAFPAVAGAPYAAPARGARVEDLPVRGMVTDPVVWSFLGLALVLTAAMIAFVALRYDTFPQQITLHFGPAGASQRDRIGERRELWTIPFLSVIVLIANTALAFVFDFFDRHDRFVPRLLAIGSALVSAVAWVVLLTLLYR